MRTALWPDSTEAECDDAVASSSRDQVILVATRDPHGLCGFAEIGSRRYAEGCETSPVAYLEGIWTDPDSRRSGLARDMVRDATEWARSEGYTEFASDCDIDNEVSRAFHTASGFEEMGRVSCFRLVLPDETV